MAQLKFDQVIEINNKKLTKQYIQSLSKDERLKLIDPIFNLLRLNGWIYPDDDKKVIKSWKKLQEYCPDINNADQFNNSSLATDICKYFCHNFYLATEQNKPTMIDHFNNDEILKKIIFNRLGLGWLDADKMGTGVNEAFNLSFKMIAIQGQRSMRLVSATSMFKPSIAKYMYMKYSQEGDTVYDYSAGWGGRMLGAISCNRKYIGADPLTTDELQTMSEFLELKDVQLIHLGSEHVRLDENSVDFSFSSPPYFDQEYYSFSSTQAYNNGEDYFYNTYWDGTLNNIKFILKPGKWFGLNVKNYPKMLQMAIDKFGEPVEKIILKTVRSHLNKSAGTLKEEYIYMFINNK